MGKKQECKEGAPEWMATFSDMMTLLMCFFVLLVSMSTFEINKYRDVNNSLKGALGVMVTPENVIIKREVQLPKMSGDKQRRKRAATMAKRIREQIAEYKLQNNVNVELVKNGFGITLSAPLLFDKGSAKLKPSAKEFLSRLILMLSEMKGVTVRVEGHTDDTPIHSPIYPSNWELSAARAASVVRFFVENGFDPNFIYAVGMGEYHPKVPNVSEENRAKNRRIEIFVEYIRYE